jgi:putative membrane protein
VVPVVNFIFYVLASLELIAEEIEDPFGTDENGLPTQNCCQHQRAYRRTYLNVVSITSYLIL